jgi:hypothetical protein
VSKSFNNFTPSKNPNVYRRSHNSKTNRRVVNSVINQSLIFYAERVSLELLKAIAMAKAVGLRATGNVGNVYHTYMADWQEGFMEQQRKPDYMKDLEFLDQMIA